MKPIVNTSESAVSSMNPRLSSVSWITLSAPKSDLIPLVVLQSRMANPSTGAKMRVRPDPPCCSATRLVYGWKSCEESAAFLRIREHAVERHDGRDAWKGCKQHEESNPGGEHCHAIAVSSPAGLPDDTVQVAQGHRSE